MGSISVACYKPRPGREAELLELVLNRLPPLRERNSSPTGRQIRMQRSTEPSSKFLNGFPERLSKVRIRTRLSWTYGRNLRRSARTKRLQISRNFRTCLRTSKRFEPSHLRERAGKAG